MRKLLLLPALALLGAGCSDSTPASVPTNVTIAPTALTFDAVGATQVVHAAVANQNGKAMKNAELTWSSSSAAVTVTGMGGDSASVTSAGGGAASVTARAGEATGTLQVTVAQTPASADKPSGDAQTATVGTALPARLVVRVRDRLNSPVAGQTISFTVESGGGTLNPASAVTGADGTASTTWTVGTSAAAPQVVRASSATAASVSTIFTATAAPGAATAVAAVAGNGQTAVRGSAVATAPRVRVTDAFNNPVPGISVTFAVTAGGGSISPSVVTTDGAGHATLASWTLGPAAGPNTLSATITGSPIPAATFTATAINPVTGTLAISAGGYQGAMVGTAVPVAPAVVLRDGAGAGVPGVTVNFAVTAGGGSVTSTSAVTNASGVASSGAWTLGAVADLNTLTASVAGLPGAPVVFRGAGCVGSGPAYEITVCITTPMTAGQRAVFTNSANRWSTIIKGDLPSLAGSLGANACGLPHPSVNMTYDDLLIFAAVADIDGPGAVLGRAGPCVSRTGTGGLPVIGVMEFDGADLTNMESNGTLLSVILHEMGHVLGIGTIWTRFGLLQNPSTAGSPLDTYYSGAGGLAGFEAIGGATYTGGAKVPVENTGGPGTMNGHWRETVLRNELMTGFINGGGVANPLSQLTVRSLADLGYTVDPAAADPFSLTFALRDGPDTRPAFKLHNDIFNGPRFTLEKGGRFTRIR